MTVAENDGRVLTCVYCGQEYPQDTPAWGAQVLTDHIKVCPMHPMRQAEADIATLRKTLQQSVAERDAAQAEVRMLREEIATVKARTCVHCGCMVNVGGQCDNCRELERLRAEVRGVHAELFYFQNATSLHGCGK